MARSHPFSPAPSGARSAPFRALGLGTLLAASLGPSAAHAQGTTASSGACVTLAANGARYCGDLVEEIPNQHIVLRLATGEVKRFAWSEIVPPSAVPPPGYAPPPPGYAPPPVPAPPVDGVRVTIESSNPHVELHSQIGETAVPMVSMVNRVAYSYTAIVPVWSPVCRAPCGDLVTRRANYIIKGEGIRPSMSFSLLNTPSEVTLRVKTGSSGAFIGGLMLTSLVGVLGTVGGATAIIMGEIFAGSSSTSRSTVTTLRGVGYATLSVGLVSIASGIALMVTSKTTVHLESGERLAKIRRTAQRPVYLSSAGLLF